MVEFPVLGYLKKLNTVPRVFAYLRRYPWMAVGTLSCAIFSTLMVADFPAVTKRVIDEVLVQHHVERLTPLVLIAALAFLIQNGLNSVRIILNNTFEQRVIFDLRSDLYSHIQMLPLRWFDNRATGDLMTRILEDVTSVERMLIDGIEQGVTAVLQLVIVLVKTGVRRLRRICSEVIIKVPLDQLRKGPGLRRNRRGTTSASDDGHFVRSGVESSTLGRRRACHDSRVAVGRAHTCGLQGSV